MQVRIKIFSIEKRKNVYIICGSGGVAEWLNAPVLKTDVGESLPWVRIPPPPPQFLSKLLIYIKISRRFGIDPLFGPLKGFSIINSVCCFAA